MAPRDCKTLSPVKHLKKYIKQNKTEQKPQHLINAHTAAQKNTEEIHEN